jgi:5-methyltetrahydropteroyltriglutamate--homocysteine methyltransferase
MLTTTRDMVLPTAITGSYPRPLWYDASLGGRSFKTAMGDSLFREQYLDAVAAIINAQEAAGLDIVTDGDSRFDLAVGGKAGSSIRSNGSAASPGIATPRAVGCSGTASSRARSCGKCRRPISPAW